MKIPTGIIQGLEIGAGIYIFFLILVIIIIVGVILFGKKPSNP